MFAKFKRFLYFHYLRFKRLQGDPHSLALGTGVGVLLGVLPLMPVQTALIVATTLLLRVSPLAALIAGTLISNPLTVAPQYYLCWKVGDLLLPDRLSWIKMKTTLNLLMSHGLGESLTTIGQLGLDAVFVMLSGGLLLGVPLALVAYVFSLRFFIAIRRKRQRKHLLN